MYHINLERNGNVRRRRRRRRRRRSGRRSCERLSIVGMVDVWLPMTVATANTLQIAEMSNAANF